MTIETFIEKLQVIQKNMPGAIMKYGDLLGPDISPRIMGMETRENPKLRFVCIADTKTELEVMFTEYYGRLKALGVSEEAFYEDLLNDFTLEDVEKYIPDRYNYAKDFCIKNNLL